MNEKIEGIFQGIMGSSNNDFMMEQALNLVAELLKELTGGERNLLGCITDDFEKKRVVALFSKMNGNINTYLSGCLDGLEDEAESLREHLSDIERDEEQFNVKKRELIQQLDRLNTDYQELLLEEQNLKQQKKQLASIQAKQQELCEEERRLCGEDGMAVERIRECQKECQSRIDDLQKEQERQKMVLHILKKFSIREKEDQIISSLTQVQQEMADLEQTALEKLDIDAEIKSTLKRLQDDEAAYKESVRTAEKIRERFEVYKSNWGEESDFMAGMYERNMETSDKLRKYVKDIRTEIQADLQAYDGMLGDLVAQGEEERDLIERWQNKR